MQVQASDIWHSEIGYQGGPPAGGQQGSGEQIAEREQRVADGWRQVHCEKQA